jgi:hypothetical protein
VKAARFRLGACVLVALVAVIAGGVPQAGAIGTGIVVSQVYGGGGNAGAPYTHDFVELFNPADTPVLLDGLSIQYASATGTGNFGANSGQLTELSGSIQPHRYFLVQEFSTAAVGDRRREPLQLEGRRRPVVRPFPAARAELGTEAARAGSVGERLRAADRRC